MRGKMARYVRDDAANRSASTVERVRNALRPKALCFVRSTARASILSVAHQLTVKADTWTRLPAPQVMRCEWLRSACQLHHVT